MKIMITGQRGLAAALREVYSDHEVRCVSRSTGHDITAIKHWGADFLDRDLVFNCAYDDRGQEQVLEFFFRHWQHDPSKTVITIGSRVITQPRSESDLDAHFWPYRHNKRSLQHMYDSMLATASCSLKIINPGPFDSDMTDHLTTPRADTRALALRIRQAAEDPWTRRLDLWP